MTVVHGTLDIASDPEGYGLVRGGGPSVVAIGKFDGVHLGHRRLLGRALAEAQRRDVQAGVVTFDAHPREVLQRARHSYLSTPADRLKLFADAGMDFALLLKATRDFFAMDAEAFVSGLIDALQCRAIVVGANFRFGRSAAGDTTTLARLSNMYGAEAIVLDLLTGLGQPVSSTRIRRRTGRARRSGASRPATRAANLRLRQAASRVPEAVASRGPASLGASCARRLHRQSRPR